jgi:hypothetical protein
LEEMMDDDADDADNRPILDPPEPDPEWERMVDDVEAWEQDHARERPTRVWVVVGEHHTDGAWVVGVYASELAARAGADDAAIVAEVDGLRVWDESETDDGWEVAITIHRALMEG